jgi:hypothetical protein
MDDQEKAAQANDVLGRIAQEAWDKTGGDVYGTEPPVEPTSTEPTSDEPVASPTSTDAGESTSAPPAKIWGKYDSLEEAERGYHEAVRMGNLAKAEADALRAEKAVRQPGPTPEPTEPDPLEDIETYGVPRKLMETAIDARSKIQARAVLQEMFGPAIAASQADKQIVEKYPEYQEKFSEIETYAKSQPGIWQQVEELNAAGKPLAARQIAYLNWKVATAAQAQAQVAEADAARIAEAKPARKDAGVGNTRRSDSRTAPVKAEKSPEEEKKLLELYHAGHTAPYLRHKLDGMLPPDFDNILGQQ